MDEQEQVLLFMTGMTLSLEAIVALESTLDGNPDDLHVRAQLLGY